MWDPDRYSPTGGPVSLVLSRVGVSEEVQNFRRWRVSFLRARTLQGGDLDILKAGWGRVSRMGTC